MNQFFVCHETPNTQIPRLVKTKQSMKFFELPRDIFFLVLSEWLQLKELSSLDIACCQRKRRAEFVDMLRNQDYSDSRKTVVTSVQEFFFVLWASHRRIGLTSWYPALLHISTYTAYPERVGLYLKKVTYCSLTGDKSESCELTSLTRVFGLMPSLTEFKCDLPGLTDAMLLAMLTALPKQSLRHLTLRNIDHNNVSDTAICKVLRHHSGCLKTLEVCGTPFDSTALLLVGIHAYSLENLCITISNGIDRAILLDSFEMLPNLVCLEVKDEYGGLLTGIFKQLIDLLSNLEDLRISLEGEVEVETSDLFRSLPYVIDSCPELTFFALLNHSSEELMCYTVRYDSHDEDEPVRGLFVYNHELCASVGDMSTVLGDLDVPLHELKLAHCDTTIMDRLGHHSDTHLTYLSFEVYGVSFTSIVGALMRFTHLASLTLRSC